MSRRSWLLPLAVAMAWPATTLAAETATPEALDGPRAASPTDAPAPADRPETRAPRRRAGHRTDAITVYGRRQREAQQPGSARTVDARQLRRGGQDDLGRVLRDVPGTSVRDEDGWGLRLNVGMRGANPERSTRVALMEDGVPSAPGPYAAPAAYAMPLTLRLERVEVLKGAAAIRFGPNAVGGALNFVSAEAPEEGRRLDAELAGGNTRYGRALLRYGQSFGALSFLAELAAIRSDGFKRITDGRGEDTGLDAGFLRRDAGLALAFRPTPRGAARHGLHLRLGYADEDSRETYLGLTAADFAKDPTRRYLASAFDRMQWRQLSARLRHTYQREGRDASWTLTTTAYAQRLHRVWDKVDGIAEGRGLAELLRDPSGGSAQVLLAVLRGAQDSLSAAETIVLGRNDRTFLAGGVSTELSLEGRLFGLRHELFAGARLHHDDALRLATAHGAVVVNGALQPNGLPEVPHSRAESQVLAATAWVQDTAQWRDLRLTLGLRAEQTSTTAEDPTRGIARQEGGQAVLLPGLGVVWALRPGLALLAGVFQGYAAATPGQPSSVRPEQVWNFDAGLRWNGARSRAEIIGFAGLYDNLVGACASSTGCSAAQAGDQFNGGAAQVFGVEASAGGLLALPANVAVPLSLSLTWQQPSFQTSFQSSNPMWGEVEAGDAIPYIPTLQASASAGLRRGPVDLTVQGRYVAPMADLPAHLDDDTAPRTDAIVQLDASLTWRFGRFGAAFVQGQNLTGALPVVSLRPFGARPGLPRLVVVGWRL